MDKSTGASQARLRRIAALMVLSTVLFVAGVLVEHSSGSSSAPAPVSQSAATPAPEGSEAREAQERQTAAAPQESAEGTPAHEEAEQNRVFGIDVEAPWFTAGVVIGTLLLIAALFVVGHPVLLLVLLVSLIAALFDAREVAYQFGQVHYGIAVLALAVVATRLATAVLAWLALREGRANT